MEDTSSTALNDTPMNSALLVSAEDQVVGDDEEVEENMLLQCAICGKTESDSSNLTTQTVLQTNATVRCGHQFCNNCLEKEFLRKREFPCPVCGSAVKRSTISSRSLDDVQCERDTSWRRRILKVFNKTPTDFATLLEYNNYLEMVEDMIYAIVNEEPNAEDVKLRIKEYEQADRAAIVIRQSERADYERSIQDRIAAEQREAERLRREFEMESKAVALAKRKWKQESTEVLLGEREEVSAELRAAQMQGYRNELKRQSKGKTTATLFVSPRVREPKGGLASREDKMDRELYRKRQAAGGGIPTGSIASQERNWTETVSTLFARRPQ